MSMMKRFGVSVPSDLLDRFDEMVENKGYVGRSEAIRDAMRNYITQSEWESEQAGKHAALNIVYRHKPSLMANLIECQHSAKAHVTSTVHVHLTEAHCLEILTIEGEREDIQSLADEIGGLSGIEYVRLFPFVLVDDEESHGHHQ